MIDCKRAEEIAGLYYDDIYHLCLFRLKKEEDAHDVTQEVFLFFQEHCDNLEDIQIKKWLYSVADKKIKEEFKKIAKREKELIFGTVFGKHSSAEIVYEMELDNTVSDKEIDEKKDDIIATLNEKEIRLFEMVYTKHMEYDELAKTLGVTINTARTRVYRLNIKIKKKVSFAFMVLLLLIMKI